MKSNRRRFLTQIIAGFAGLTFISGPISLAFKAMDKIIITKSELSALRKKARNRKRRIIMNNDGNDVFAAAKIEPVNEENFLKQRTLDLAGTQVDSIFYCSGVFNNYTHPSKESELLKYNNEIFKKYYDKLFKLGQDPLKMVTEFGHKNKIEVFWSMRMNDTHDSGKNRDDLFCNWKREHPEYLVGKREDKFPYGANRWSSVNYEIKEVREKVLNILYDVCSRYDIDGIELDFFRHPVLFKQQMFGEKVSQAQCDIMTGFIDQIIKMTTELGQKRGRPYLIAIRIPDSVDFCKEIGIDLITWLNKGFVDLISTGDYFKLEPWENLASLGKKFRVPVYACFENRRIENTDEPEREKSIKIWRGEALNAWKAGVDGIYTFNVSNAKDPIFRELGNPKLLENLDHIEQTVYVRKEYWSRPEVWLKDGDKYVTKEIKKF
jgi:hypothetical protein